MATISFSLQLSSCPAISLLVLKEQGQNWITIVTLDESNCWYETDPALSFRKKFSGEWEDLPEEIVEMAINALERGNYHRFNDEAIRHFKDFPWYSKEWPEVYKNLQDAVITALKERPTDFDWLAIAGRLGLPLKHKGRYQQ